MNKASVVTKNGTKQNTSGITFSTNPTLTWPTRACPCRRAILLAGRPPHPSTRWKTLFPPPERCAPSAFLRPSTATKIRMRARVPCVRKHASQLAQREESSAYALWGGEGGDNRAPLRTLPSVLQNGVWMRRCTGASCNDERGDCGALGLCVGGVSTTALPLMTLPSMLQTAYGMLQMAHGSGIAKARRETEEVGTSA